MRQLIITYTMYKQDKETESSIRLSMRPELAGIVLSGNTFPALEDALHALAEMQGYDDVGLDSLTVEEAD